MVLDSRAPTRTSLISMLHKFDLTLHIVVLVEDGAVVLAAAVVRADAPAQAEALGVRDGDGAGAVAAHRDQGAVRQGLLTALALLGALLEAKRVVDDGRRARPSHSVAKVALGEARGGLRTNRWAGAGRA